MKELNDVEIIFYDSKIYVPQSLCRRVLDWYHFYLNHPGCSRLAKTICEVCYWKFLVTQVDLYDNLCNICQQFKNRKTIYGNLPPKNIAELKPWNTLHVDIIVTYSNYIRQQRPGVAIIHNNFSLTCMTMIGPATGRFLIIEFLTFDLDDVMGGNDEYIDKSYARVIQLLNNK